MPYCDGNFRCRCFAHALLPPACMPCHSSVMPFGCLRLYTVDWLGRGYCLLLLLVLLLVFAASVVVVFVVTVVLTSVLVVCCCFFLYI